jgi:hypothetical protein
MFPKYPVELRIWNSNKRLFFKFHGCAVPEVTEGNESTDRGGR